jgi:hypothetical protein
MLKVVIFGVAACVAVASSSVQAQVGLDTYQNADGYIDIQKLTCAQLANTFQEDANALTMWYSGWYNGLGKKHFLNFPRAKESEHLIIVYCKEHPDITVIKAIGTLINEQEKKK